MYWNIDFSSRFLPGLKKKGSQQGRSEGNWKRQRIPHGLLIMVNGGGR